MSKGSFKFSYETKVGKHKVLATVYWEGDVADSEEAIEDISNYLGFDKTKHEITVNVIPTLH